MTSDIDILRTAKLLVDHHGDQDATLEAAMRADELLGKGDLEGAARALAYEQWDDGHHR